MREDFAALKQGSAATRDDIESLKRAVRAIESFPMPNGRPKTFLSAAEVQSVSGSKRTKYSYQG
jgi:hypothetical protein